MSTVYSLAAHRTRELFELGKYWAPELLDDDLYRAGPWVLDELISQVKLTLSSDRVEWFERVAPALHAFCVRGEWDVDVVNDCSDELFDLSEGGYRMVGSVYSNWEPDEPDDWKSYDHTTIDEAAARGLLTLDEARFAHEVVDIEVGLRLESTVGRLRASRASGGIER